MDLGEKLYELRKNKNLSQENVAEQLNVTRQTISKWETNQSTPDFDKIVPLCELYGITPNELLTDKVEEDTVNTEESFDEAKKHLFTRGKEDEYENMTKEQVKRKSAEVISGSVFLFIFAIAFAGIGTAVFYWNPVVVGCVFLLIVGMGVVNIIKHFMSIPKYEKTDEERKEDSIVELINGIIGALCVAIYFIVSFTTFAWHITWVIFIIDGLLCQIVKLIFMLKNKEGNKENEK